MGCYMEVELGQKRNGGVGIWGAVGSEEEWRWGGNYSLVCGGGGTLCTGLELEDGRVLLPAPWFPPPFT